MDFELLEESKAANNLRHKHLLSKQNNATKKRNSSEFKFKHEYCTKLYS